MSRPWQYQSSALWLQFNCSHTTGNITNQRRNHKGETLRGPRSIKQTVWSWMVMKTPQCLNPHTRQSAQALRHLRWIPASAIAKRELATTKWVKRSFPPFYDIHEIGNFKLYDFSPILEVNSLTSNDWSHECRWFPRVLPATIFRSQHHAN